MAKIPQEAQELFAKVDAVVLATAREDGQPNVCMVGMKKILDDETIYLSDQFFTKTLANVQANDKIAVGFWGEDGAYNIYGTAEYINEGAQYEELAAWANGLFEKIGMPIVAKGGIIMHVDAVYNSMPGPAAGAQIA